MTWYCLSVVLSKYEIFPNKRKLDIWRLGVGAREVNRSEKFLDENAISAFAPQSARFKTIYLYTYDYNKKRHMIYIIQ